MMINVLFYRALWFLFICTALLGAKCDKMAVAVFHPTFPLPLELLKIASEKLLKRREKRTLFSANVSSPEFNEASFIYSCKQILALFNKDLFSLFLFFCLLFLPPLLLGVENMANMKISNLM